MLEAVLRISTPLLFAALGGLVSERSGVINIALEGMLLMGAFAAAVASYFFSSPFLGMLAALVTGILTAAFYALFVVNWRANQIVAGTAINLLTAGLTPFLLKVFFNSCTSSPALPLELRYHLEPVVLVWVCTLGTAWLLSRSSLGLWIRFAGENPEALETAGVSVKSVRWLAVLLSGALAGLGGASLSICLASSFTRNMSAGRGFMALAALIFGKWRPFPTAAACLLFSASEVLQNRLQGVVLWGHEAVPIQFIQISPYLLTIIILAGFVGKARAPQALGRNLEL